MSFAYRAGYVGPFAIAKSVGRKGEIQKFRYVSPTTKDRIGQFLIVLRGEVGLRWSTLGDDVFPLKAGGSFTMDGPQVPLEVDTELTVMALEDAEFLCISAYGLRQKVAVERHRLMTGDAIQGSRHELMIVTGDDAQIQISNGPVVTGPRLIYARHAEPVLKAHSPVVVAACTLAG